MLRIVHFGPPHQSKQPSCQIRSGEKIAGFKSKLVSLHDELADLKSYFDAQSVCCLDPAKEKLSFRDQGLNFTKVVGCVTLKHVVLQMLGKLMRSRRSWEALRWSLALT